MTSKVSCGKHCAIRLHCSGVLIWFTWFAWHHSVYCFISSRDHVRILGLSTILGRVMSLVIPIVGPLAVHVAFRVVVGAVALPVAVSSVAPAAAVACASSVARFAVVVGSLTVAVPSVIICCAPA